MDKILQEILTNLCSNELNVKALRALFDERIEKEKPVVERTDTDEIVGQKYRAYNNAKELLEVVLKDLEVFRDRKVDTETINKGK